MTSLFEEIPSEELGENDIVGGVSVRFDKDEIDIPRKRFENLVVPIGLQLSNMNIVGGSGLYYLDPESHTLMDESRFSKLFYSVAKDLGVSLEKSRRSITKKNRR
jgi:putative NADH-flavin reductase